VVIFLNFGWIAFATLTERPGVTGNMYYYYQITIMQFFLYKGLFSVLAFLFALNMLHNLIKCKSDKLNKTMLYFVVFFIAIFIIEYYLDCRFVPKG
jgi:hypothetical protein